MSGRDECHRLRGAKDAHFVNAMPADPTNHRVSVEGTSRFPQTPPLVASRTSRFTAGSPSLLPAASITAEVSRGQVSFVAKWLQMSFFSATDTYGDGWARW